MTILLTGAAGFIGRHFAAMRNYYTNRDNRKLVCVDKVPTAPAVLDQSSYMNVDLHSVNEVIELFRKVQPTTVVHLAGISRIGEAADENVLISNNLFAAAKALGPELPHFVFAGSAAEYGDLAPSDKLPKEGAPLNPVDSYAKSKADCCALAQAFCENERIPMSWMRFANVYGPAQDPGKLYHFVPNVINAALHGEPIVLNARGMPRRQFVYVTDICRALWLVTVNRMSGVYNLGGDELTMKEAAQIAVVAVQDFMLRNNMMPQPAVFDLRSGGGGAMRVGVDSTKALSELGWRPLVGIYQGMKHAAAERIQGEVRESRKAISA